MGSMRGVEREPRDYRVANRSAVPYAKRTRKIADCLANAFLHHVRECVAGSMESCSRRRAGRGLAQHGPPMTLRTGGELVVASLIAQGTRFVFGVPGESYL